MDASNEPVRFTCSYGAPGAVPDGIKDWMLMRINTLYNNPSAIVIDQRTSMVELPADFIDGLPDPYHVNHFEWAQQ